MNPIRFQCQSCSQPIEVDEEWADKTVACPYCKSTVIAPAQTTLTNLDQIHTASPVSAPVTDSSYAAQQYAMHKAPSRNAVAVVALSLSILLILLFIIAAIILSPHRLEMENFQEMVQSADSSTTSQMQVFEKFTDQYGGTWPGWFVAAISIQVLSVFIFLAAVVCGSIGIRRKNRKHLAVISLAICGGMFIFFIAGALLS